MLKALKFGFTGVIMILLAGCEGRMAPIENFIDEPAIIEVSLEQMAKAVETGAVGAGWRIEPISDVQTLAAYQFRNHTVVVTIDFSPDSYSIVYRNSFHMKVMCSGHDSWGAAIVTDGNEPCPNDAAPTMIHMEYNTWVRKLNDSIQRAIIRS